MANQIRIAPCRIEGTTRGGRKMWRARCAKCAPGDVQNVGWRPSFTDARDDGVLHRASKHHQDPTTVQAAMNIALARFTRLGTEG